MKHSSIIGDDIERKHINLNINSSFITVVFVSESTRNKETINLEFIYESKLFSNTMNKFSFSFLESLLLWRNPFKTLTALRTLSRRDEDEVRELCCLSKTIVKRHTAT